MLVKFFPQKVFLGALLLMQATCGRHPFFEHIKKHKKPYVFGTVIVGAMGYIGYRYIEQKCLSEKKCKQCGNPFLEGQQCISFCSQKHFEDHSQIFCNHCQVHLNMQDVSASSGSCDICASRQSAGRGRGSQGREKLFESVVLLGLLVFLEKMRQYNDDYQDYEHTQQRQRSSNNQQHTSSSGNNSHNRQAPAWQAEVNAWEADPYLALGLSRGSHVRRSDIRKAFLERSLQWHPDRNPGNQEEANARFQAINNAYDILNQRHPH